MKNYIFTNIVKFSVLDSEVGESDCFLKPVANGRLEPLCFAHDDKVELGGYAAGSVTWSLVLKCSFAQVLIQNGRAHEVRRYNTVESVYGICGVKSTLFGESSYFPMHHMDLQANCIMVAQSRDDLNLS